MAALSKWSPQILSLLRILTALLFMEHGLMKLFHFPAAQPGAPDRLPTMLLAAAWIEVVGGGLIALGLFTRAAAFVCSGEMAIGYFTAHATKSFWPAVNQGDAAILFCFVFFYLVFAGPGPWSLDALVRRGGRPRPDPPRQRPRGQESRYESAIVPGSLFLAKPFTSSELMDRVSVPVADNDIRPEPPRRAVSGRRACSVPPRSAAPAGPPLRAPAAPAAARRRVPPCSAWPSAGAQAPCSLLRL
jgi:putative oxidoreductase